MKKCNYLMMYLVVENMYGVWGGGYCYKTLLNAIK